MLFKIAIEITFLYPKFFFHQDQTFKPIKTIISTTYNIASEDLAAVREQEREEHTRKWVKRCRWSCYEGVVFVFRRRDENDSMKLNSSSSSSFSTMCHMSRGHAFADRDVASALFGINNWWIESGSRCRATWWNTRPETTPTNAKVKYRAGVYTATSRSFIPSKVFFTFFTEEGNEKRLNENDFLVDA